MPSSPVLEARLRRGLSQAELAAAAGISRQAIGAIEAGRHRPGVDAALAISAALGRSVESLFGDPAAGSVAVVGGLLPDGEGVVAARVGDRAVHAPAGDVLGLGGWPEPNAVLRDGRVEPFPDTDLAAAVVVGCDPALGLAASLVRDAGAPRVVALSGTSAQARAALDDGRAHAAIVHGPAGKLPQAPDGVVRVRFARWRAGVAAAGRAPAIADLCAAGTEVVQRPDGAATQQTFLAAVTAAGHVPPAGPRAGGHLDVAQRVLAGAGAGVTIEPAALRWGLGFTALDAHEVELWIDARWERHPAIQALGDVIVSRRFAERLALVGGYDLDGVGTAA